MMSLERPVAGSKVWHLCHHLTQERVPLPASTAGDWVLDQDESGFGYVDDGDSSMWCQGLLTTGLFESNAGQFVRHSNGLCIPRSEFLSRHRLQEVGVVFGEPPRTTQFGLGVFEVGSGCRIWWRLKDLYATMGLTSCKHRAYTWAAKRLSAWQGLRARYGLPESHLVWPSSQEPDQGNTGLQYAASTSLFLLVLGCGAVGRRSSTAESSAGHRGMQLLTDAMFKRLSDRQQQLEVELFLDGDIEWRPPRRFTGAASVTLAAEGGRVHVGSFISQLKKWGGAHHQVVSEVLTIFEQEASAEGSWLCFGVFLTRLVAARSPSARSLVTQLVVAIGVRLEQVLFAEMLGERSSSEGLSLQDPCSGSTESDRQWRLMRYWWAARQRTQDLKVLHIALDCTTIGRRKQALGVASVGEVGIFLPPQATWASTGSRALGRASGPRRGGGCRADFLSGSRALTKYGFGRLLSSGLALTKRPPGSEFAIHSELLLVCPQVFSA